MTASSAASVWAAHLFSFLGSEWFYLLLLPILFWKGRWEVAVKASRAMVFADLVGEAIKWTLRWPRPAPELALAMETSPGFVSTHAALSMAVALILAAATPIRSRWRWGSRWGLLVWVLGVGWSRLRLGVHFPLDVLGGWVVGVAVAGLVWRWGRDRRACSACSLGLGVAFWLLWPSGGLESLHRDLGLLLGLEVGLLWRLAGDPKAAPPSPLPWSQVMGRLLGLLGLYVGLRAGGVPRLLRYFALGLWTCWRSPEKLSPPE